MTTGFKLSLPIDIPWQRICVSDDMIERVVCDEVLPPKWHSSIAIFKYRPDDEYQQYADYDITYLKVTCTITGYQPLEDEIQGQIEWKGIEVTSLDSVMELLSSYYPCTGAILQVVVGPRRQDDDVRPDQYPFFMDFEPKKRELYEMATDTNERQSRSIESLSIGKSGGTTKSLEVLDIDMGGGINVGVPGFFNFGSSNQGQWGTKSVNTQDSQSTRNTELGTERRETQSFTTQLSQMYHLLDSYHVGTNRAVFFLQPRPHVLEEPTGFVLGPRKVEGIQEFFLIVAAPKDHKDYCISTRLDTAHLAETDVFDYETRSEQTDAVTAEARTPTRDDAQAEQKEYANKEACFWCPPHDYACYRTIDVRDVIYSAPSGFEIIGFVDLVDYRDHGTSSVTITPDRKMMTLHAEADGHICFYDDWGAMSDEVYPDEIDKWSGSVRRQVQVQLRSTEPTRKVGTRTSLLITTRGLCCCDAAVRPPRNGIYVVDFPYDPATFQDGPPVFVGMGARMESTSLANAPRLGDASTSAAPFKATQLAGSDCNCEANRSDRPAILASIRRANAISDACRQELTKHVASAALRQPVSSFIETDLFASQIQGVLSRSRRGRDFLAKAAEELPPSFEKVLAERLRREPTELSRRDVLRYQPDALARESGLTLDEILRIRLAALGIPVRQRKPDGDNDGEGNQGTTTADGKKRFWKLRRRKD